jgi:hypothetical protein
MSEHRAKKILTRFAVALALTCAFGLGDMSARVVALRHLDDVVSVIGFASCRNYLGAAVITRDGVIHPMVGISLEDTHALSEKLADDHKGFLVVPCGAGDSTT